MNENIVKAWSILRPQLKDDRVAFVLCPANEYRRKLEEVLREDAEFVDCELSIGQKQDLYNLARERHGELLIVEVQ